MKAQNDKMNYNKKKEEAGKKAQPSDKKMDKSKNIRKSTVSAKSNSSKLASAKKSWLVWMLMVLGWSLFFCIFLNLKFKQILRGVLGFWGFGNS